MEAKLRDLIEAVHDLGKSHKLPSGVIGNTTDGNILLDMYRKAAEIIVVSKDKARVGRAISDFRGTLLVAEATNTIGSNDLERIMNKLDEIESEL